MTAAPGGRPRATQSLVFVGKSSYTQPLTPGAMRGLGTAVQVGLGPGVCGTGTTVTEGPGVRGLGVGTGVRGDGD